MITVNFPDMESARKAALSLEHHGLDGSTIEVHPVVGDVHTTATPSADRVLMRRFTSRAFVGGLVAVLVLAALVVVLVLSLDVENTALWLVAGLAGAVIVGAVLGAFFNVLWGTPMSHGTLEALDVERPGPACVVVASPDPDEEARAEQLLQDEVGS